jgi:hypothetical protein
MGPLVDSDHANRVEKFVSEVPRTAVVCGGNRLEIEGSDRYFQPTIARVGPQTGLDRRARIVTDEVFGPAPNTPFGGFRMSGHSRRPTPYPPDIIGRTDPVVRIETIDRHRRRARPDDATADNHKGTDRS